MRPFPCSEALQSCNSYLYHISGGRHVEEIASLYSVNLSEIKPIIHGAEQDYLVYVPCTCTYLNGTNRYSYDTSYKVKPDDSFARVYNDFYSGQVYNVTGEDVFKVGNTVTMHPLCGCVEEGSQEIVTYTAQEHDTLSQIAHLLSSNSSEVEKLNPKLTQDPSYIDVGWVLYVPMENRATQGHKQRKMKKWIEIAVILSVVTLASMSILILLYQRRNRRGKGGQVDPEATTKSSNAQKTTPLKQLFHKKDCEDEKFESDKPVMYSSEDMYEATKDFDDARRIGERGYGSVYYGILGNREVAVKKMKSSRLKEFFAELKVLCKIHHINVYVPNDSLNDHLHDPLLKGHQPLSWTARANIALDAERGIEYIHDHTKVRYVHRDIKTSNILLDQRLRAKVMDNWGLILDAKLVEGSNDKKVLWSFFMTRETEKTCLPMTRLWRLLLPCRSVCELQMTSKGDVYAFGVVLAEIVTGQRALARDDRDPSKFRTLVPTIADLAWRCLNDDAFNRPEMKEIVHELSHILTSSMEWDASLGGNDRVFSGLLNGR
ncbi:hypothetical protein EUGRSUZ_B00237 [Eucalyptus grandis]|uniref:Uncharacterized protein n=2 Tax=Eucalyptus grandis TaxID=71139 RepID=A0ACC3LM12_EUCGR|nr:hypothetical protein EUGRSUZ_B00237 [Eucalyptus grandis]